MKRMCGPRSAHCLPNRDGRWFVWQRKKRDALDGVDGRARQRRFSNESTGSAWESTFPEEVQSQLELLARFAALALALAERRGTMEELSSIIEATKKLNSTLDLGELIHIILQIATRQSGAERGTVFLLDTQKNEIWSLVGLGLEQQVIRLPADRGIAGWVAQNGRSVRLENAYEDHDLSRK